MAVTRNQDTGQPIITGSVAELQEQVTAVGDYARYRGSDSVPAYADLANLEYVWSGMIREVLSEQAFYMYVSEAAGWVRIWKRGSQPFAMATGLATNDAGQYATVPLPAGRFTVPPIVQITPLGSFIGWTGVERSRNKDQFRAAVFKDGNVAIAATWMWTAIQMTPTSAEG